MSCPTLLILHIIPIEFMLQDEQDLFSIVCIVLLFFIPF